LTVNCWLSLFKRLPSVLRTETIIALDTAKETPELPLATQMRHAAPGEAS